MSVYPKNSSQAPSGSVKNDGKLRKLVNQHLVDHTDSSEVSEEWSENFSQRPSWCDAALTLQQINAKKATGNTIAFSSDSETIEKQIESLPEVPKENGLGDAFQVIIQTSEVPGQNMLSKESLLKHVELMNEISQYSINLYGRNWSLADICFKPPPPNLPKSKLVKMTKDLLDKIIPCVWITPIDCFWEGSKPLGPRPPLELGEEVAGIITTLPKHSISWKNLNPGAVLNEVGDLLDSSIMRNFYQRAGVTAAYMNKPCINPLDPECPESAPNAFKSCDAYKKFDEWNQALPGKEQIVLETETSETMTTTTEPMNSTSEDYYEDATEEPNQEQEEDPDLIKCRQYKNSFLSWMEANPKKWEKFLSKEDMPKFPDFGKILTGGCTGFGRHIMKWPESLIIGGIGRDESGQINKIEAFQSVFLVASPEDLYHRVEINNPVKRDTNETSNDWTPVMAQDVIKTWQRNFTSKIYNHRFNDLEKNIRVVHPLASTSIKDILAEFSEFNFTIIILGYVLMIIYASWTQLRWRHHWFSVESTSCLAIIGVLLITFSFISGLGVSIMIGINFNAATTQIIPFLALGLGISDMFLLLYNYTLVIRYAKTNEIAVLLKETGMAVIITSMNIILAFVVGIVLPTPALRAFCAQVAILLFFNLVCNMVLFTASMAIDLKRRKAKIRDMTFGCLAVNLKEKEMLPKSNSSQKSYNPKISPVEEALSKDELTHGGKMEEILHSFVRKIYIPLLQKTWVKAIILAISFGLLIFGSIGLYNMKLGLELSDVLPEGTAPSAFLKVREKYFGFYPMYIVLKGPIDIPHQQKLIENLRNDIDLEFKKLLPKINNVAMLARRLVCSVGNEYNCTRVGRIKLVDDGIINPDGFYNYLTGWFHVDNMMYYVSQAAFFPTPLPWTFELMEDTLVPPAPPLHYSQMPFYLNNLTNTQVIVEMIKEIRTLCEKYTDLGVPNFPTGIPFTFWEQYLRLTTDLIWAIFIITGTVLLVISTIIFNPWAAAMVAIVVVCITIQLGGFMGLFGIKLNPVSSVTLISAVGIGVEFTAYIILSFLASIGTRNERMAACLDHMFIPVVHGGISALLGLIMLAFTEFEFIFKYFFVVMAALIVIGMFNGVALLPVLLSLCGPPSEAVPSDGSNRLHLKSTPRITKIFDNEQQTQC
uniref:SSD domain-containing protein n=1 Tax=Acrobeloides nanus TaxID=290746 RepID=A0A914C2L8_9BILA